MKITSSELIILPNATVCCVCSVY